MDQVQTTTDTNLKNFWAPLYVGKRVRSFSSAWIWHILIVIGFISLCFAYLSTKQYYKGSPKMTILKRSAVYKSIDSSKYQDTINQRLKFTENSRLDVIKKDSHSIKRVNSLTKNGKHKIDGKEPAIIVSVEQRYVPIEGPLELIRKDPKRIYLDKMFVIGDLTYSIRNVSEQGIELYISNNPNSIKTYYFPKVEAEGSVSHFNGTIIPPSGNAYGWIIVPNIKDKRKLDFRFSSIGGESKKESVKLEW